MNLYFGQLGPSLLDKCMQKLKLENVDQANEQQRVDLLELLLDDCFSSIMSNQKVKFVMSELISALNIKRSKFSQALNMSAYDTTGIRPY